VELGRFGADPLEITESQFVALLNSHKSRIKALLLDQSALRGVGNIYADESLWRARIHPMRIAARLSAKDARNLRKALQEILRHAIALRGSSIIDFLDAEGEPGEYQRRHRAYGREGEKCYRCKTPIRREIVAGRSSFFCPKCQPAPRQAKRSTKRSKRVTPEHRAAS
jgi:formamidopyrimidine-DNA glycosylase